MSGAYGMNAAERRRWREESSPTGNHAYARQKEREHDERARAMKRTPKKAKGKK